VGAFFLFVFFNFLYSGKCHINLCVKPDLEAIELGGKVSSYFRDNIYW